MWQRSEKTDALKEVSQQLRSMAVTQLLPYNLHEPFIAVARDLEALADRADKGIPVSTRDLLIPVTEAMLEDIYSARTPVSPPPPESFLQYWRRRLYERYWAARWNLAKVIAGRPFWYEYGEDDD